MRIRSFFPIIVLGSFLIIGGIFFYQFFLPSTNNQVTLAGTEFNVSGWAWSENIGWISFNNTSGGGTTNYGVNIDPTTGNLSGYAWSENIGWIRFDPPGPYPDLPNYSACLDIPGLTQGACDVGAWKLSGWIRVCAGAANPDCSGGENPNAGGWAGWIKLSGTNPNYGVFLDSNVSPVEFKGWVWGGGGVDTTNTERENRSVIGWISFNCSNLNVCQTSNYKVGTTLLTNLPPSASGLIRTAPDYCTAGGRELGAIAGIFSWTFTDPNLGDNQSAYEVEIDNNSDFSSPEIDSGKIIGVSTSYSTTTLLSYGTTYYWRLRVWDSKDLVSDWILGSLFETPSHAYPLVNFTHYPQNPLVGEVVTFKDQSTCYDANNFATQCQVVANTQYLWNFGNNAASTQKGNATTTYTAPGNYTVTLRITDSTFSPAVSCTGIGDGPVNVQLSPPEWIEIPPF